MQSCIPLMMPMHFIYNLLVLKGLLTKHHNKISIAFLIHLIQITLPLLVFVNSGMLILTLSKFDVL